MRPLREFREFVEQGSVVRQSPDKHRARSLVEELGKKRAFLDYILKNTPKEEVYPNFVIDYCYDIILEYVRARMILDGYNSDSHEAEVAYMRVLGFSNAEVRLVDELRYFRNGIKYYGKVMGWDYGKKVISFINKIYPKLKRLVE